MVYAITFFGLRFSLLKKLFGQRLYQIWSTFNIISFSHILKIDIKKNINMKIGIKFPVIFVFYTDFWVYIYHKYIYNIKINILENEYNFCYNGLLVYNFFINLFLSIFFKIYEKFNLRLVSFMIFERIFGENSPKKIQQ